MNESIPVFIEVFCFLAFGCLDIILLGLTYTFIKWLFFGESEDNENE